MRDIFTLINSKPEILNHRVIVLAGKNWHHGVIGIVAARILEYYSKPTIIISIEENGSARGSARSVKGFNIFKCLEYSAEYLTKFGGHECAGGFSLDSDKIDDFAAKVYEFSELSETPAVSVIRADKILTPEDLTVEKVKGLSRLEPLGAENPQPVFLIAHARVDKITSLSQGKHTKLDFTYGSARAQALMFGTQPDRLCFKVGDIIDMMVNLEINRFGGRESVSVRVLDCRRSGLKQERYFAGRDSYEKLMRGEELPQSYIRKMIPQRAELVALYKQIRQLKNTDVDTLFMYFEGAGFNYPKLHICVDIFRDKGLIGYEAASGRIKLIQVTKRVDLEQSETLQRLNKMLEGAQ
jgi:single-stranded-DNA-specific exonuclease